jgi:hypothetical protein
MKVRILVLLFALFCATQSVQADALSWNLPLGIGTVQLPWQSTEVFYGMVRPIRSLKSGLGEQIAGASLPVLTIGKLASGYRILDGQVGAAGTWPVQSSPVNPYFAVGHDVMQDIPGLPVSLKSAHVNGALTYLPGLGGWYAGGTASYAFGTAEPAPTTPAPVVPTVSKLNIF